MRGLLILSAATLLVADNAFGQDRTPPSKAESYFFRQDSALMKRAALGIELRATGTRRDTLGVFVAAVTPRGPAETAGIIEGDRIATINGVDVRSAAGDIDDPYTNGLASHRLSKEVQKLTPGARVTLRVYSGGRFRDVVVTAGRASEVLRHAGGFNFRVPGPGGMGFRGSDGAMMFDRDLQLRFEQMGPEIQKRLKSLPRKIEFRRLTPGRVKVIDLDDALKDFDDELLDLDIEPLETEVIRELVAQTARDATEALRTLAVAGILS